MNVIARNEAIYTQCFSQRDCFVPRNDVLNTVGIIKKSPAQAGLFFLQNNFSYFNFITFTGTVISSPFIILT